MAAGEVVTLLGHNGSGKTTTIKTILGLFPAQGGRVTYQGRDVTKAGFRSNVRAGMALIPSERFVFPDLTVIDNLLLGGANERDTAMRKERLDRVHELFPILAERAGQQAGTLSGGQQRMLSLGLLLMAGPKLLMLDEPSLGPGPRGRPADLRPGPHAGHRGGPRRPAARAERGPGHPHHRPRLRDALGAGDPRGDRRADARRTTATGISSSEPCARTGGTMPKMDEAEVLGFLDEPGHLVRIANVDADGWPRVVPTWFVRQGDDIVFTPRAPAVFLANIRRDPRIALTVDEDALPYRKVTVQGTARVLHEPGDDDVWRDLYRVIATRYIPDEQADDYIQNTIDQPRALIGVSMADARTTTWRMPVDDEAPTGIWARRYYVDGTVMADLADQLRAN